MTYAARHPDLFSSAASFSGAPEIARDPDLTDEQRATLVQEREEARHRRGQNEEKGGAARAHGISTLAEYNCRLRGDQAPRRFPLVGR